VLCDFQDDDRILIDLTSFFHFPSPVGKVKLARLSLTGLSVFRLYCDGGYQSILIPAGRIDSRPTEARRSGLSSQIDMERGTGLPFEQNRGGEQLAESHRGFGAGEIKHKLQSPRLFWSAGSRGRGVAIDDRCRREQHISHRSR
jgi:hypothetical protein